MDHRSRAGLSPPGLDIIPRWPASWRCWPSPICGPVPGEFADQVVDSGCGGQAGAAGDGLPPAFFSVVDRLGHREDRCEVLLRDDDEAAGVAADHVPGTDGHAAALHDDVDRPRSLVRSRGRMGAYRERRQPRRVETVEVTDGAVD